MICCYAHTVHVVTLTRTEKNRMSEPMTSGAPCWSFVDNLRLTAEATENPKQEKQASHPCFIIKG